MIYNIKKLGGDRYFVEQMNKWNTDSKICFETTEECLRELLILEHKYGKNRYYQFMIYFMNDGEENCISEYENVCECGLLKEHKCNIEEFQSILEKYFLFQKNIFLKMSNSKIKEQ